VFVFVTGGDWYNKELLVATICCLYLQNLRLPSCVSTYAPYYFNKNKLVPTGFLKTKLLKKNEFGISQISTSTWLLIEADKIIAEKREPKE
jgi:hypothetical protein